MKMDYSLENLGPDRFQEICQALLVKEFPGVQCFPIAQSDGGRDDVLFYAEGKHRDFIVYQVKYVQRPFSEKNPHRRISKFIKDESQKIAKLIPQGAEKYVLITNIPGTAIPGSGSIDTVRELFDRHIEIPAQCLWRDDINRRLDDAWDIKWSYPEILNGPDIVRMILQTGLTEQVDRRTTTIKTFLRGQYDHDTDVRFKQVELQNELLDLFIDVPIDLRAPNIIVTRRRRKRPITDIISTIAHEHRADPTYQQESGLGTATLLLHPLAQKHLARVVIEGAPGQGKSTIAQYICQIHRRHLLGKENDERIPDEHQNKPVRLPFKIDCRDFAVWMNRTNPFSADDNDSEPTNWKKSLESFLCALITYHSGGSLFDVSDLHAVVKISPVVLVFDGLDEVADIRIRNEIVDEIIHGTNRLETIAVSLQTVVTSRPAVFANSPGLPEDLFLHIQLTSITRDLVDQYANKWLKSRKLHEREASDIRNILKSKLDQPHLRELAHNPMQLSILLSLIHIRGASLPDKRTALYDSYVDLFFNREAEKSNVVRDHRDLLINIHRYLAWILHSEAQTKQTRGSITEDRLQKVVRDYLDNEGHDSDLAQNLFTGMVERVVALVSRVQGTFEFEVQPLREYFAARYLYSTAPYSPPGAEQPGTLPERFDALARDFFWQNVTRFYAGCYDRGQLPSLVHSLEELASADGYRDTGYPQSLAATLLSDWVFAQYPKLMKKIIALVLDGVALRQITTGGIRYRRGNILRIPKQCGNVELLDKCFDILSTNPSPDFTDMLLELIRENSDLTDCTERWLQRIENTTGTNLTRWIRHGLYLGILSRLSESQLDSIIHDDSELSKRLDLFLRAGQTKFIETHTNRFTLVIDYLLDDGYHMAFRRSSSIIDVFISLLSPRLYAFAFENPQPIPLASLWDKTYPYAYFEKSISSVEMPSLPAASRCWEFALHIQNILRSYSATKWTTQLEPWEDLIETGRSIFGNRWIFCILANIGAGIRSRTDTCDDAVELCNDNIGLCRRARYARLRAGVPRWWQSQLLSSHSQIDLAFTLLMLLTWAGPSVFHKHSALINEKILLLDDEWWMKLSHALRFRILYSANTERRPLNLDLGSFGKNISPKFVVSISIRVDEKTQTDLYHAYLENYNGNDDEVLKFCQQIALYSTNQNPKTWERWLPVISRSYVKGVISDLDPYFSYRFTRTLRSQELPREIAEKIIQNCDRYPIDLVGWAENVLRTHISEQITPVGTVAEDKKWFQVM